jgi:hypothetical protein
MKIGELVEAADRWELPIGGCDVTQCQIDYAFSLVVAAAPAESFYVTIEQPFWFRASSGSDESMLVPEGPPVALGPALAVLRSSVERAVAYKDGRLEIQFTGGAEIRVPVGKGFEAWNLTGPGGLRFVSLPGGELAVWSPDR